MLRTLIMLGLIICALPGAMGCAGLVARRVPVEKRLAGQDTHYDGFRYYLARPYLVVSKRIDVVTITQKARLVMPKEAKADDICHVFRNVFLEVIDEHGCPVYFDLHGRPHPGLTDKQVIGISGEVALEVTRSVNDALDKIEKSPKPGTPTGAALLSTASPADGPTGGGDKPATPKEPDAMYVVYLPDFEEQMAVRHCSVLAKSKMTLAFQDGWQLLSVNGNFDSTDVPVQVLSTVRNAIGAAGEIENKRLTLAGAAADAANKDRIADLVFRPEVMGIYALITRTLYIEPGVYRLSKPREIQGEKSCGAGLLADLGLPVNEETKVQLTAKPNR